MRALLNTVGCARRPSIRLARLVQLGVRQSRYFGRAKTRFQLLMAATVANPDPGGYQDGDDISGSRLLSR